MARFCANCKEDALNCQADSFEARRFTRAWRRGFMSLLRVLIGSLRYQWVVVRFYES